MDKKKRFAVQSAAALIQNANFKGFFTGKIYTGAAKSVCVPGLNCYSCPGAVGACPIGSLQNSLSAYNFKFPYYVVGLIVFFGAVLGRIVCGFLCPFGFLQDLIDKLPFPKKIGTFKYDKALRKIKYAVLVIFVIVLPLAVKLTPFFCKYICPSGTLSGILLALGDKALFSLFGSQFMWKLCILCSVLLLSAVIFRPFCKYICPLGAFYGLFNKYAAVKMSVDSDKCISCGKCAYVCKMNCNPATEPNSAECIRCGDCIGACPEKAIEYTAFDLKKTKENP